MEAVLDRKAVSRQRCGKIVKNNLGYYDLTVTDEGGRVVFEVSGVGFPVAVSYLEDYMYTNGRTE